MENIQIKLAALWTCLMLTYKSGYLPKFLGIILLVVALCYFIQDFGTMLLPQHKALFTSIGSLAFLEIAFPLWLLIKGVNVEQWQKRVSASVSILNG